MEKVRLGKTDLVVSRTGFGAIPIQRISFEQSEKLLIRAYESGIDYYDTARSYTDSEAKIGKALGHVRDKIIIATKTPATNKAELDRDIKTSLSELNTDYIDIYQMHNPERVYEDVYEGLLELKQRSVIRHIGITYHSREKAYESVISGKFDTLQFPLAFLSSPDDLALIDLCKEHDIGLLAMKGLAGGLINDASCAFSFLRQFENVVPLWGVERMSDLEEFIALESNPPLLDDKMQAKINTFIEELQGNFCRACGYCMPCSVGISIPTAARITLLMNRTRYESFITDEFENEMSKIDLCTQCGLCKTKCPYKLDIPNLLKDQYEKYKELKSHYKGEKL